MTPALTDFVVTVCRFDPADGPEGGELFELPVRSPDAEHAIASTLANAASWPGKVAGGQPAPVAFIAVKLEQR